MRLNVVRRLVAFVVGAGLCAVIVPTMGCSDTALEDPDYPALQTANTRVSDHTNETFVEKVYRRFYGREPEQDRVDYYSDLLNGGFTREYVTENILTQPEGQARLRVYDERGKPVDDLYRDLLKRPADDDGLRYWTDVKNRQGTKAVALGIITSQEFATSMD